MKPQAKAPASGARKTNKAGVVKHVAGCGKVGHAGSCEKEVKNA